MIGTLARLYDGDGNAVAKSVNGVVTHYVFDDLNPTGYPEVVEELNSAGTVERVFTYGLQRISENQLSGSTPNNYLYSGEQYDPNTFLYYQRARYYQNATGRFWARDPVEGKKCCGMSWNPYIYVKDNPVNSVDPTGREGSELFVPGTGGAEIDYLFIAGVVFEWFGKVSTANTSVNTGICLGNVLQDVGA